MCFWYILLQFCDNAAYRIMLLRIPQKNVSRVFMHFQISNDSIFFQMQKSGISLSINI